LPNYFHHDQIDWSGFFSNKGMVLFDQCREMFVAHCPQQTISVFQAGRKTLPNKLPIRPRSRAGRT
jgi:hypothetical protein